MYLDLGLNGKYAKVDVDLYSTVWGSVEYPFCLLVCFSSIFRSKLKNAWEDIILSNIF